jgi:hypothetical protein
MLYTAAGSFSFSLFKWFFQGTDYSCGFGIFPTFGMKAMEAGWNFDFQHNYVGAGGCCNSVGMRVHWKVSGFHHPVAALALLQLPLSYH